MSAEQDNVPGFLPQVNIFLNLYVSLPAPSSNHSHASRYPSHLGFLPFNPGNLIPILISPSTRTVTVTWKSGASAPRELPRLTRASAPEGRLEKERVERTLLPVAVAVALDVDRTPFRRGAPFLASFARSGNHGRLQRWFLTLVLLLTLPVWNGHSCPLPLTLLLISIAPPDRRYPEHSRSSGAARACPERSRRGSRAHRQVCDSQ
jgi:hypothetical protein